MADQNGAAKARRSGQMLGTGSSTTELVYGMLSGMAFGLISPVAAMPFDCVKTKMQAEARFRSGGVASVVRAIIAESGAVGFYRGLLPILASTGVQKTVLFAANSGSRRACENSGIRALAEPIPGTGGLKCSILIGGVVAAAARTVVETPFELTKVRWQTGGSVLAQGSIAQIRELYIGATATFARAALMLTTFFVLCDYTERTAPELVAKPLLGGFFKGGICATAAWLVAWPFETVKSRVQGSEASGESTLQVMRKIVSEDGPRALYRGFLPGAGRSFVANGVGMAVYSYTQSLRTD